MSAKLMTVDNQRHYAIGILDSLADVDAFYQVLEDVVGKNLWMAERKGKVRLNLNIMELQSGELLAVLAWRELTG